MFHPTFLNPRQQEAVESADGPVMVIAGPGSGKTRVLTHRIAHLITRGVPASRILALTFTNKAANEMRERVVSLVGKQSGQLWMGTFHSICARILRKESYRLGFEMNFSIYDTADTLGFIKNIMVSRSIPLQQFHPQAVRARISDVKNQLLSPDEYRRRAGDLFEEKTAGIYAEYQTRLKQNNAMDFDDLLLRSIELFEQHKKTLEHYEERFHFLLIDEYQDTNRAQYVLIKMLAAKHRNISVVGDDAQSIYAFRGADIRNILDFERDYPEARIIRLEQNYRSTQTILAAADQVIRNNRAQIGKSLWTENEPGDPITILACDDDKQEGAAIASQIVLESHHRKIDFKDFAIMYRTNAQSRSLEDALRRNGIPYVIVGGTEFYQRKEIKDFLAYLRVLVNPKDDESLSRIINYPPRGIGENGVAALRTFARKNGLNLLEAAALASRIPELSSRTREGLQSITSLFGRYRDYQGSVSLSELCRSFVDEIGILKMLKEEGTPESIARWENVQELLSAISEFSADNPEASLDRFLQDVALVSDIDRWDDARNAVTLMTLHSAKGLEFPVVFISGLEEGLLPFYNSEMEIKTLEEERRLFYVGITRAMKKLYLTCTNKRFRMGDVTYPSPSRFFGEVDENLCERKTTFRNPHANRRLASTHDRREPDSISHYGVDEVPEVDVGNDLYADVTVGCIVEHDAFGRGRVVGSSGGGEMRKVAVEFTNVGRKNLLLKYARLKII